MSRAYLGELERGEKAPTVDTLQRLARAIGVEISEFFGEGAADAHQNSAPEAKLARLVAHLAKGAPEQDIERFEKLVRAYFGAGRPRGGRRRRTR